MAPGKQILGLRGISVLVTGATGKIGRILVSALLDEEAHVAVLTRTPERARELWPDTDIDYRAGDLTDRPTLVSALEGIEVVFHLASYSPSSDEVDIYETPAHWDVTAEGTRALVNVAVDAGVRRIVYLSSVKAMGDAVGSGAAPADESTPPVPDTLYGRAKLAAEDTVLRVGGERQVHAVVLRLPMIYGLDGQGNIARMMDAIARDRFPPWPRVENRRTAVHVDDAVSAAILAARMPQAAGQVYLVNDGKTYSTRWLYEQILHALGRPVPRWTVPLWLLRAVASFGSLLQSLTGRPMPLTRTGLSKLVGNAWYDAAKIHRELGFVPKHSLQAEIRRVSKGLA